MTRVCILWLSFWIYLSGSAVFTPSLPSHHKAGCAVYHFNTLTHITLTNSHRVYPHITCEPMCKDVRIVIYQCKMLVAFALDLLPVAGGMPLAVICIYVGFFFSWTESYRRPSGAFLGCSTYSSYFCWFQIFKKSSHVKFWPDNVNFWFDFLKSIILQLQFVF